MTQVQAGTPFFFDDHVVGDEHPAGIHEVSSQEIIEFASKWDPQPWHLDEAVAASSVFGGLTACSAHVFSIFSITSQHWQSGVVQQAIASLGFDQMRMLKPVYAGDTLRCLSTVASARPSSSKADRGIVEYQTQLINQRDEVVFSIRAACLMAKDPARNRL